MADSMLRIIFEFRPSDVVLGVKKVDKDKLVEYVPREGERRYCPSRAFFEKVTGMRK